MADVPVRPPPPAPPLPAGWTEHAAPSGHVYYFHKETKKSTYVRPVATAPPAPAPAPVPAPAPLPPPPASLPARPPASLGADAAYTRYNESNPRQDASDPKRKIEDLIFGGAQNLYNNRGPDHARGGHRGGLRGGQSSFSDRTRQPKDRPKHRHDIPNCAPWVLVRTKLGRRFVWNKDTNESFWKFPPDVMQAVVQFDRMERESKERKERGEPSDVEEDDAMADIEAGLAAAEEHVEIVEVDGEEGMDEDEEYEEVEVTDDEGDDASHPQKRQRTEEPAAAQPPEDEDLAWQLAQMEEMEGMEGDYGEEEYLDEEPPLSEEDCKALFKELLDDTHTNPYTPWDKILEAGALYEDDRYKALPNMKARKECFDDWSRDKMQYLKEQKAKQQKLDPRVPYLAFLDRYATPKLYWPEFRRKYKKEPELKDAKLPDKEKEKLYREHIKRVGMRSSELKSDLTALLKAQPLAALNHSTTFDTLPPSILTDLRYISLAPSSREPLIETYISTLPPAPTGAGASAEEEAEAAKRREERRRREKALAERERRVQEEKRKQERDLAYGKGRLREEEMEIERAMNVGKQGLKAHLGAEE